MLLKIVYESILQAFGALRSNKLRSFLSLLGIMIGIFCIISIKSAVNSLEANIKEGFSEFGSNTIYLDKMPWNEDPGDNYWKYAKRPDPSFDDLQVIQEQVDLAEKTGYAVFSMGRTVSYGSSSVDGGFIIGPTYEYSDIAGITIEKGRYFTPLEYEKGDNKVILGNTISEELFGEREPVGKEVKLFGQKFLVIGKLEAEGENMFNFLNFDEGLWLSYNTIRKFVNVKESSNVGKLLAIQGPPDVDIEELKDEVTGVIRAQRRLRPFEDDNFVINEISMLDQVLDKVFKSLNIAALVIGIFALIVGMFSVANIMFVSVKERTNIIGIKKALGAKKGIILSEFLIEAIILCLLGGLMGLGMVYVVLTIISNVIPFNMSMTMSNMMTGLIASIIVGIIAGIIPAMQAAKMDPVDAIRA